MACGVTWGWRRWGRTQAELQEELRRQRARAARQQEARLAEDARRAGAIEAEALADIAAQEAAAREEVERTWVPSNSKEVRARKPIRRARKPSSYSSASGSPGSDSLVL